MSKALHGHKARKRFGQNFLHDQNVISKIVASINPKPDQNIVEIGPGLGAITSEVLPLAQSMHVVELDRDLIPKLEFICDGKGTLTVHQSDALKFDFSQLADGDHSLRVIGNLPYNISTPLIFHLLENHKVVRDMHFMLQKEVVDRMGAKEKENNYGRLSVMTAYFCKVEPLFLVGPGSFNPPPKVESAIVRLTPYETLPFPAKDLKTLQTVVTTAFGMRRKTLRNCLKKIINAEEIESLGIDPTARAETLSVETFVNIANYIFERPAAEQP